MRPVPDGFLGVGPVARSTTIHTLSRIVTNRRKNGQSVIVGPRVAEKLMRIGAFRHVWWLRHYAFFAVRGRPCLRSRHSAALRPGSSFGPRCARGRCAGLPRPPAPQPGPTFAALLGDGRPPSYLGRPLRGRRVVVGVASAPCARLVVVCCDVPRLDELPMRLSPKAEPFSCCLIAPECSPFGIHKNF